MPRGVVFTRFLRSAAGVYFTRVALGSGDALEDLLCLISWKREHACLRSFSLGFPGILRGCRGGVLVARGLTLVYQHPTRPLCSQGVFVLGSSPLRGEDPFARFKTGRHLYHGGSRYSSPKGLQFSAAILRGTGRGRVSLSAFFFYLYPGSSRSLYLLWHKRHLWFCQEHPFTPSSRETEKRAWQTPCHVTAFNLVKLAQTMHQ